MKPRRTSNPKRSIQSKPADDAAIAALDKLAVCVRYGGNPEHKKNPGTFHLQPPSSPRKGKTLCDAVGIFSPTVALSLIKEGIRRGLVSVQKRNGWPQNVWAVCPNGMPVEAMLENSTTGSYHGYPMLKDDPLADEIKRRWRAK